MVLFLLTGCFASTDTKSVKNPDSNPNLGYLGVIQLSTSQHETQINIFRPRFANYKYLIKNDAGFTREALPNKQYFGSSDSYWIVEHLWIESLEPNTDYDLIILNKTTNRVVETRVFKTLNLNSSVAKFVIGSCLSDNFKFRHISSKVWDLIQSQRPDFIFLLGDNVYIDEPLFVQRTNVLERNLWDRYVASLLNTPLLFQKHLLPILATWDDHDMGTNNSNTNFKFKTKSKEIFLNVFGAKQIPGIIEKNENEIYLEFTGFKQKFFLLDNRFYRLKPISMDKHGYLGKEQNEWLINRINLSDQPTWISAGGQFFSPRFVLNTGKQINESFMEDYISNHQGLMNSLQKVRSPIAFLSGDVHFSEILKIEKEFLGYTTYEFTSSPMYANLFRIPNSPGELPKNSRRIHAIREYNFLLIESHASKEWKIHAKALGPNNPNGFFEFSTSIQK